MYKHLYVIANGFDLYHNMETSLQDFQRYCEEVEVQLCHDFEGYFDFRYDSEGLWKDFESDLSTYLPDRYFDDNNSIDISEDNFQLGDAIGLEDDFEQATDELFRSINDALSDWINQVVLPEVSQIKDRLIQIKKNSFFLTFNFTQVLEEIYGISEEMIFYLHGDNKSGKGFNELVFGHCTKHDYFSDDQDSRNMFSDAQQASRKPLYTLVKPTQQIINDNIEVFDTFSQAEEVIVLGHSFGEVDLPYFYEISKIAPNSKWLVSYYSDDEKNVFSTILREKIGINAKDIQIGYSVNADPVPGILTPLI